MFAWSLPFHTPGYLVYISVFGAAALACFAGAWQARRIDGPDVRRGLIGLLSTSGLWASAHVGMLLSPTLPWKTIFYEAGLVVGFGTVWAWLWLCSAYSGRALHRHRAVQGIALLVVGAVTLTKLTNAWHGLYFAVGWQTTPFPHLQVDHRTLYWGTAALSYALATVGFFMVAEPLRRVQVGTGQLAGLFGLTALPLLANGAGYLSPALLDVSHEPVGVAAFAVGVLFVYRDRFEETGRAGPQAKPVLLLSGDDRLRNYNEAAATLFPALRQEGAVGRDLSALLPEVAEARAQETPSLPVEENGRPRYYRLAESTYGRNRGRQVLLEDVTERALRRRVREQEHRFLAEAVGQAREAVLVTEAEPLDKPGPRIVYANEAFEEMTGYREEEVLGRTPRLLQGPETDRSVLDSLRAALETGERWQGETVNYRKDGTPYTVQWNVAPVTGEEGEIRHWVSVQRDVTEQRDREQRIRRQKSLLKQTQRLAGAWEADLQAGQVSWSEKVYEIHEMEPGSDVGLEEAIAFYPPEVRGQVQEVIQEIAEESTSYDLELPIVTAKGNRRWVRTVGAPSETSGGEVTKVAGALQDITERRKAEQALREQEGRLRGLANSIPGVIFQTGPQPDGARRTRFVGKAAEDILGLPADPEEFRERFFRGVPKSYREKLAASLDEAVDAEQPWRFETPFDRPDGERIWLFGASSPTRQDGELLYNGVLLDITERVERRKELESYRDYTGRLLNAVEDLFFVFDEKARLARWNDRVEEVTGHSSETLAGMDALGFVPAEDRKRVAAQIANGFMTGHMRMEIALLRENETTVPYEIEGNLVDRPGEGFQAVCVGRDISERKRRKQRLERQNDLFERAQEIANVGAWEYDVRKEKSVLTDQAYRIHGLPPDRELTPEQSLKFYHPDDRSKVEAAFRRAVEEGVAYDIEVRLVTEAGENRWVRTRGEPQFESGEEKTADEEGSARGEVVRVRGTVQDITERMERRRELEQADTMFRGAQDPLFLIDVDHASGEPTFTVDKVNPAYEEATGIPAKALSGRFPAEGDGGAAGQRVKAQYQECLDQRVPLEYEVEVPLDGKTTYWETRITPVLMKGTVEKIVGSTREVTDRRKRAQLRRARRQKIEALYEATNQLLRAEGEKAVGALLVDLVDGTFDYAGVAIRFVEDGWLVPTNISSGLQAHMPEREPYPQGGDSPVAEAYRSGQTQVHDDLRDVDSALNRGEIRAGAYVPIGRHGTLSVGSLQVGGIGSFDRRLIEVITDYASLVLDRVDREEVLRGAKEEAERARKEAEAASQAKSVFLANMSHEIRTPLTSILGFAEAIGEEVGGGEETKETDQSDVDLPALRQFASLIESSGERLMSTLTGVLNLSKLEAGEMSLDADLVDLATEADKATQEFTQQAQNAGVNLVVERPPGAVWVRADEAGVQIVLRNLLSNAIKYTGDGGEVRISARTNGDTAAVLEVADTGIGMDPSTAEDLFEPFRQESEGLAREYEGTGLGLAVTRKALHEMGGSIEVETEKEEGSCFTVRLPVAESGPDEP